jgi:uncharacterized protein (UPF0276 family)
VSVREGVGVGLRAAHYAALGPEAGVDLFEAIADNYLGPAALPLHHLDRARALAPVLLHGVGLNLLGPEPLDRDHLRRLRALADRVDTPYITDHLCWTGAGGRCSHDLLPAPLTEEVLRYAVDRVQQVQDALGRPFGVENLAAMLATTADALSEWEFLTALLAEAGCGLLLDVNNLYVAGRNQGYDPRAALAKLHPRQVLYVHVAGHQEPARGPIVDTHDAPVRAEVWALYAEAWERLGPFPTVLEWDAHIPPYDDCVAEARRAIAVRGERVSSGGLAPPGAGARSRSTTAPACTTQREQSARKGLPPPALQRWQHALLDLLFEPPIWRPPAVQVEVDRYPPDLVAQVQAGPVAPVDRLRAYHEQLWFRWIGVLQEEHPTLAQVLGLWEFNRLATAHLTAHPPSAADVGTVADGLDASLTGTPWDTPMAQEAAALDRAWRELLRLPPLPTWTPPRDEAALLAARLRPSPATRRLHLRWPLPELRATPGPLPAERPATWLLVRTPGLAVREIEVEPALARLLALLDEAPLGVALARLEAEHGAADLPARVRRWLEVGVRLGWWAG